MTPTLLTKKEKTARKQHRGFMFLGTVLMIAFAGSVAGITVLYISSTQARIGEFHRTHAAAEAAAEAGLVWAHNQLNSNPNINLSQGGPPDLTIGPYAVDVYIDPPLCPCPPGTRRTVHARVVY